MEATILPKYFGNNDTREVEHWVDPLSPLVKECFLVHWQQQKELRLKGGYGGIRNGIIISG